MNHENKHFTNKHNANKNKENQYRQRKTTDKDSSGMIIDGGGSQLALLSDPSDLTAFSTGISIRFYDFFKRLFDVLVSFFGLLLSSPLWVLFALLIKLESRGSVFFHKVCYAKNGEKFKQWKFRSMVENAEKNTGPVLASENDRRITKIGWFLRKTALDELPQLINIFLGDMSFVGPRPQRVVLVDDKYAKEIANYHLRHLVRPGLTGLAQVYGRYDTPPKNKLRYDLLYVQNYSFLLDVKLFFLSIWITLRAKWQERSKNR